MSQPINSAFRATILVVVSAACFASAVISPCLPFIAEYFQVSSNQTTLLVSNFLFGYICGQLVFSILSQFAGYKTALLSGFFIYIVSCVMQIVAINNNNFDLLFYSRFICALGASSGLICVFAIINDFSANKEETQKLISLAFISLTLFAYLSITLGGLISHFLNWIFVFYVMMIVSILEFILIYQYIPDIKKTAVNAYGHIIPAYLRSFYNYKLILPSLLVAFTTTSTYLYNAVASTISATFFHLSSSSFGFISILNLIGLVSGGWFSTKLIKQYGVSNSLLCGIVISSIPVTMLFLLDKLIFNAQNQGLLFFSAVGILNLGLGIIYPAASYLALNAIDCSSTASSIMNFFKIACPAFIIYFVGKSDLALISSYQIPLFFVFMVAVCSCISIKFSEQLKTS